MSPETSMGGAGSRFQSTLWETILKAKDGEAEALEQLISDYWKPAYFFIRRKGYPIEEAKDLTQGFLGQFLEKDALSKVSPELGRFRSFVMASLENYLSYQRRREGAIKRGGGLNFIQAERDLSCADESPRKAFFKGWALVILERAMERFTKEATPEDLELLHGAIPAGMSPSERKNRRYRMRLRLRQFLREDLLPKLAHEKEVESEIREILQLLS